MGIVLNIQEIASKENQYIKLAKNLHDKRSRAETGLFLLEGRTLIKEALPRIKVKYIFINQDQGGMKLLEELGGLGSIEIFSINEDLMARISTTENPPPILAIAEIPKSKNLEETTQSEIFLYCEDISDPGNLGSIIRTAFAAGVKVIYLSPSCVDIYNTKVLRSSMGIVFYGSIIYTELEDLIPKLKKLSPGSLEILGTTPYTDLNYNELKFNPLKNILLLVGNETRGLSDKSKELCTQLVKIPLENSVESINVLAATSVILFQLNSQRNADGTSAAG